MRNPQKLFNSKKSPFPHTFQMLTLTIAMPFPFSLLFLLSLLTSTTAAATTIGVTYIPSSILPPPDRIASALQSLKIAAVHIPQPDPTVIRAFSYTNISLLLSIPNSLITSFSTNRSSAQLWLYNHVVPFYPRARITSISVGNNVLSDDTSSDHLIPAIRNVHLSLRDLGIKTISVSTTFNFVNIMTTSFPPSSAEFQQPVNDLVIKPLLQFLDETNSSFFINLHPYTVYRLRPEIPIGYALFQEHAYNFRDDLITGVRYRNLFDMMVDSVVAAMTVSGHENIPVVVTETGWPSFGGTNEADATAIYAEMYLKGLIEHMRSGIGTPLRKEGVAGTYIYELFDGNHTNQQGNSGSVIGVVQNWGIMYANMTMKYKIGLGSNSAWNGIGLDLKMVIVAILSVITL